jgi:hypothetical protein
VRLHQASTRYGVNSRKLGSGSKDVTGLNKGFDELASGAQVLSYFDAVMHQQFLPSGRVQYFPMCNYTGDRQFESLLTGQRYRVDVRRKVVDAAFVRLAVPSTHAPQFAVAPGVTCVPLNDLPKVGGTPAGYVVVGSGKTGIDACLWLLENGVDPEQIRWIMPRDAWYLNRANFQSDNASLDVVLRGLGDQTEAILQSSSIDDLLERLEAAGQLFRIDRGVRPTTYRCATVTRAELEELRRIRHIVRMGRVRALEADRIVLERGELPANKNWLYIHCSAKAFSPVPRQPVFAGDTITLQAVRTCQPIFSAALIAYLEAAIADDATKNAMSSVVPLPEVPRDWLRMMAISMSNQYLWSRHEEVRRWLVASRLDGMAAAFQSVTEHDTERYALLKRYRASIAPAVSKIPQLLAD